MRVGIVFNPRAGVQRGNRLHARIKASVAGNGHTPLFLDLQRGQRLEVAMKPMLGEADVIAVVGGDGTLNGVVNAVLTSERPGTPIAFLPAGRGKDTARTLPSFSIDRIGQQDVDWNHIRPVDVGKVTTDAGASRYFINASDVGLSAVAGEFAAKLPRRFGATSYVIGAVKGFLSTKATSVRITLDGDTPLALDDVLTISVCNGKSFGGGIYIAPEASAEDGLFTVVAVRSANLMDLVLNLGKLKTGEPFDHPALTRWEARTVRIERSDLTHVDLDGEMWGTPPLTYEIVPGALNWIGPRP